MQERVIENLEDTKDAIEDNNDKFISALADALNKERKMYEDKESQQDLDRLRM